MAKKKSPSDVVQTAITMERHLKERYSKLAFKLDLNFSQLVRFALRHVENGIDSYEDITPPTTENAKVLSSKDIDKAKNM